MDYEKAYKEALGKATKIHNEHKAQCADVMSEVFPELKESEDERIKRKIREVIDTCLNIRPQIIEEVDYLQIKKWLEKQGEQKSIDNLTQQEAMDIAVAKCFEQREQKLADNVEPKFKVEEGKWYVCTQTYVLRGEIVVIKGQTYQAEKDNVIKGEDGCLFVDWHDGKALDYFRSWTIQDAKDGDVLATLDYIIIFKKLLKNDGGISYCHYNFGAGNPQSIWFEDKNWYFGEEAIIHPATKEQRNLLFQKMKESGYEWDAEKKGLKKIEPKPAWSEEDEDNLNSAIYYIRREPYYEEKVEPIVDWLKSLKDRYTWKPSEEQMKSLQEVIDVGHFTSKTNP